MLRLLIPILLAQPAHAFEGEWRATLISALELPGLASQSPTDFDLVTYAAGLQASYSTFDWLALGGRVVFSQFDGVIEDYTSQTGTMQFKGDLHVDLSAWRAEALIRIRLLSGFAIKPHLILAGGYTWTIYRQPTLTADEGRVPLDINNDDFANGSFTTTATLSADWRILPFLEIGFGVEATRHFAGLYETALRFPLSVSGVFWGPL